MPNYSVEVSPQAVRDLSAIFEHLVESYGGFGDSKTEALTRAGKRTLRIRTQAIALGRQPHQGTLRPNLLPGLRSVTKDRAIFYFEIDEEAERLRVLAIFFGGQDHQRAMLMRLSGKG